MTGPSLTGARRRPRPAHPTPARSTGLAAAVCRSNLRRSFSGGGDGDECVELTHTDTTLLLRESDTPTRVLPVTPHALAALLRAVLSHRPCS
ncbi:DUF397 domain-containing protein [Streptomyces phyllanthi]|uniref:DUF397 domain-containing protein n=1 Tax=Streptomyces phyllanthi TaxID=1803180 RepID=UPI0031E6A689